MQDESNSWENTAYLSLYKVQTTTVNVLINKINMQQDTISGALLQNHILKSRKKKKNV